MTDTQKNQIDDHLSFLGPQIAIFETMLELFLSEEEKKQLTELIADGKEQLNERLEKFQAHLAVNKQMKEWRNQTTNSKNTRIIVKITNNTTQTLKVTDNNVDISPAQRDSAIIPPEAPVAFKLDLNYERFKYTSTPSKKRIIFESFIDFADQDNLVRFEFSLLTGRTFGAFKANVIPLRKTSVTAFGENKIKCTSEITEASADEPFNFEVHITLD